MGWGFYIIIGLSFSATEFCLYAVRHLIPSLKLDEPWVVLIATAIGCHTQNYFFGLVIKNAREKGGIVVDRSKL